MSFQFIFPKFLYLDSTYEYFLILNISFYSYSTLTLGLIPIDFALLSYKILLSY